MALKSTRSFDSDEAPVDGDDPTAAVARLLQRAVVALVELRGRREGDVDEAELPAELADVNRSLATLGETVDPAALVEAVDVSRLPTLVDWSGVPEAFSTGDYRSAVAYENPPEVIDASRLLEAGDVRESWRRTRELGEEVEDVTDALSGGEESAADDPATEEEGRVRAANDDAEREAGVEMAKELSGSAEGRQFVVQRTVSEGVAEARSRILAARERIAEAVEGQELRSVREGRSNSRNPTAVSTLPRSGPLSGSATTFSSVPTETRYSDAPNFERIYGPRFERERET